ncbi:MAG: FAD-dependent oxidoreductase, partial [Bryobacteraceae bacterium]
AWVDPRDVTAALRRACQRRGVIIVENSPASELESAGMRALIIAAGAWSSGLRVFCDGRTVPLPETFPVKGHLLGYRMPAGSLNTILRRGHTYILQRSNGFTIAGSNEEDAGFDRGVNAEVCAAIHTRAGKLWPALEVHTAAEKWIGFRPGSRTGEPAIGRCADSNVWLAYGHYRNGILMAPATAQRIASEIVE